MNEPQNIEMIQKVASFFSPSAPIDQRSLFAGRIQQLTDVLNAVEQKGQHVILFGERGVGKTSLASVISSLYQGGVNTPKSGTINCDSTMTYSSLWHKIFREMIFVNIRRTMGFDSKDEITTKSTNELLPNDITPDDVRHILSGYDKTIIAIDELDRISDKKITSLMADTIKNLSDHATPTTLILVGVADSVESLIQEHQSVERALVQIRMPRMSKTELHEIIDKGLEKIDLTIEDDAKNRISALSQGLPHYTHLLSLHAAQATITDNNKKITTQHVRKAIDKSLAQAQQSIVGMYHKATNSPRENLYPQVLLACSMAETDNLGYFAATDVRVPMKKIMGKPYDIPAFSQHLNAFCESARGPILQRTGTTRRFRFRFINPLMQPFVIMDGIKKALIKESEIYN